MCIKLLYAIRVLVEVSEVRLGFRTFETTGFRSSPASLTAERLSNCLLGMISPTANTEPIVKNK